MLAGPQKILAGLRKCPEGSQKVLEGPRRSQKVLEGSWKVRESS